MSKPKQQQMARELRSCGKSLKEIATELGVSKSSVSVWVRDVELTENQRKGLLEKQAESLARRWSKKQPEAPLKEFPAGKRHHTKDKGDVGVGFVISDLLSRGIQVAITLSEHLPFDIIAIYPDNSLVRLSVKYRRLKKGVITIELRSSWTDRHGTHHQKHDKSSYDATAIYCPDSKMCYYVKNEEVGERIRLRVSPSRNGVCRLMAEDFVNPERLSPYSVMDSIRPF